MPGRSDPHVHRSAEAARPPAARCTRSPTTCGGAGTPTRWRCSAASTRDLFEALDHSPIRLLGATDQERFEELAGDDGFLAHMDRVAAGARPLPQGATTWFCDHLRDRCRCPHRVLLRRVRHPRERAGLLRRPRRARRRPPEERQRPRHPARRRQPHVPRGVLPPVPQRRRLAAGALPRERLLHPAAHPGARRGRQAAARRPRPLPGREVQLRIWHIQVGRVPLYLLDANIPQNRPEDRAITAQLYGGDQHTRIQQEIILGIGGIRALKATRQDADRLPHERGPRGVHRAWNASAC